jgi:hypothetical protein
MAIDILDGLAVLIQDLHPVAGTDSTRLINGIPEDFVVYADSTSTRRTPRRRADWVVVSPSSKPSSRLMTGW